MLTDTRQVPQRRKPRKQRHTQLIALRVNAGLSREALAARTGVSRETIRIAELGWTPGVRIQFAIAQEFDLLPLDLWPIEVQRVAA